MVYHGLYQCQLAALVLSFKVRGGLGMGWAGGWVWAGWAKAGAKWGGTARRPPPPHSLGLGVLGQIGLNRP